MSNLWTQFENLLEKEATQLATIISSDGTTATVELLSGDRLRVTGPGTAGDVVYIKGEEIKQQAPSLPRYDMILY